MKRLLTLTLATSVSLLVVGCGGEKAVKQQAAVAAPECSFPGTSTAAPLWVCDAPVPGVEVYAVGVSESSKAGVSFMRDRASADARGRLAEQVKVRADKMVKTYVGSTGAADAETVDAASSSTTKTLATQTLYGSKIYRSIQAPDGRYFVLLGIDKANAEKIVQQSVRTSMNNDQALWQKFQAEKSFDEMAAEIAKQNVQ